jgi:hypothetical protein
MKKKLIILASLAALFFLSCKKYREIKSDVNNDLYIFGKLQIQDSINDNGILKPFLRQAPVTLSYKHAPSQILYTTTSDTSGFFSFLNLTKGAEYVVAAKTETGSGDFKALFTSKTEVLLDVNNNSLTPTLLFDNAQQNGVLYTIKDDLTNGLISGCHTCFFSSQQLFLRDTCDYGLFTIPSNSNGLVLKTNLQPGKYYVLFKKQAGSLLLRSSDVIDIPQSGIIRREIKLF